jgi:hypothetical protein
MKIQSDELGGGRRNGLCNARQATYRRKIGPDWQNYRSRALWGWFGVLIASQARRRCGSCFHHSPGAPKVAIRHHRLLEEEKERRRQEAADRLRRMQERKERIAKREAFIEQKAKDYSRLIQLKAFDGYLVGQSQEPDVEAVASIGRVAQELVDRMKHALSVPELNQEIDRLGLYTADDY